jgi:hypothetical protein
VLIDPAARTSGERFVAMFLRIERFSELFPSMTVLRRERVKMTQFLEKVARLNETAAENE